MIKKVTITKLNKTKEIIFLICINIVLYINTLFFGFVWDDIRQIVFNDSLLSSIRDLSFLTSRVGENVSYYRPVFFLSLALDAKIFGFAEWGFHLTNLFLHILVVIFAYRVVQCLSFGENIAFLSALIFTLHPSHSESVAWVSARNELLYSLFGLIAFNFYIKKSFWGYPFFILSILSKETAVVIPMLFLFYDFFWKNKIDKNKIFYLSGYFVLNLIYLVYRKYLLPEPFGDPASLLIKLFTIINNVVFYLKKFIYPFDLKIFYSGLIKSGIDNDVLFSFILLLLLVPLSLFLFKKDKRFFFFIFWFLLLILPVSGLVITSTITFGSDRYLYLPSFGLSFLMAYFIIKVPSKAQIAIILFLMFFWGGYSIKRNLVFKNQEVFIANALKDAPDNPLVWNEIGVYYFYIGEFDKAEEIFKKVISLNPKSYGGYYDLARVQLEKGFYLEAKENFLRAISLKTNFVPAYYFLGEIALLQKDFKSAENFFYKVLELEPNHADANNKLGELEALKGNHYNALKFFEKAYKITPDIRYLKNIEKIKNLINSFYQYK